MERKRTDNEEFARICEEEAAAGNTVVTGKEADLMPCISLWQPWAQFIALGWKTIETRTHKRFASLVGRRIGIHAANKWDPLWTMEAARWLTDEQCHRTLRNEKHWRRGVIVCTATVDMHRLLGVGDNQDALIDLSWRDRFGLCLSNVKETTFPNAKVTGKQGIFYLPLGLCV